MLLKPVGQLGQAWYGMIVTDGPTTSLPDVLLRVELGSRYREIEDLQTRIRSQHIADRLPAVPRGSVPHEKNGLTWISVQYLFQMLGRRFSIHDSGLHHDLLSSMQIECAVEVHFLTPRVGAYHGSLTPRCPDGHRRQLQVQTGLILGENHSLGSVLGDIDQFFSSCSSNSAILVAERDLYAFAGR